MAACSDAQPRVCQPARLRAAGLPALRALTSLTLEHGAALAPLDLRPLSVLQRLEVLRVAGAATGLHSLPPLRQLEVNPCSPDELQALGTQTCLEWLGLAHDPSPLNCPGAVAYSPADFVGLCSLPGLQCLSCYDLHLDLLDGGRRLTCCSTLCHLHVKFQWCGCCDTNLDASGLAGLTQLSRLSLSWADEGILESLDSALLSSHDRLTLDPPLPFATACLNGHADWPRLDVCRLDLVFEETQAWHDAVEVIKHVSLAYQHWAGGPDILDISAWPGGSATLQEQCALHRLLRRLRRHRVELHSAAATVLGADQAVTNLTLYGELSGSDTSSGETGNDSDAQSD